MKSSELSNGENRIALRQLLQNRNWLAISNQCPGNCPAVIRGWTEQLFSAAGQIYSDRVRRIYLLGKKRRDAVVSVGL